MDAPLIERWTAGADWFEARDGASVSQARELARRRAAEAGLEGVPAEGLATAASELARNLLDHARAGRLAVRLVRRAGVPGVEVVAADRGPGIPDPAASLEGRAPRRGLGAGLAGARRLTQELDIDVRAGEGSCVRVRTFARAVPRSEVAVHGRPFPGEPVSGDDAAVVRTEEHLLVAVADGLGHGPEARAASRAAVDAIADAPAAPLADLLARARTAVARTRGAVLGLVRLDLAGRTLEHVGVGDVKVLVHGPEGARILPGQPGFLGERGREARPRPDAAALSPHGLLLLATDGLRTAAAPPPGPAGDPVAVAQDLLARFARDTDDALVVVVRTG